nr:MAG TPA: hypothetical protein [Caudoviricetes sp.]
MTDNCKQSYPSHSSVTTQHTYNQRHIPVM